MHSSLVAISSWVARCHRLHPPPPPHPGPRTLSPVVAQDFATAEDARHLVDSHQGGQQLAVRGQQLLLDYAFDSGTGSGARCSAMDQPGGSGVGAAHPHPSGQQQMDWLCEMCSSVNFARRLECYNCSSSRPANPRRVAADPTEPSTILKISGLEPQARCACTAQGTAQDTAKP